jgi:hypothetical protein
MLNCGGNSGASLANHETCSGPWVPEAAVTGTVAVAVARVY